MNKQRLRKLIKAIEKAKPSQFKMEYWLKIEPFCGTVGCAIGHFCVQNPDEDLKLITKKNSLHDFNLVPTINVHKPQRYYDSYYCEYKYKDHVTSLEEWFAVGYYFDIPIDHATKLLGNSNKNKQTVIKEIRAYMNGGWKDFLPKQEEPTYGSP